MTIDELKALEPRLREVEADIRVCIEDSKLDPNYCANEVWYRVPGPRERLIELVGWVSKSKHPEVRTQEAYDVAYNYFYNLLPDCKHPFEE